VARACATQVAKACANVEIIDPLKLELPSFFKPHFTYAAGRAPEVLETLARKIEDADWAKLIEVFQPRHPKLAELMLRAEDDVLAYKTFPQAHWRQIHSTNPLERLNKEIKRRTNVIGIFPNEPAIKRLVGALMLEQNDEWAVTRRYMTLETVAAICEDNTMDPAKIAAL